MTVLEFYVDALVRLIASLAEVGAALVILSGVIQALYRWARHWRQGGLRREERTSLGWSIVLGLEFLVAADVLVTAVAPTWSRLGQVAVVIFLRILLAYFLELELQRFEEVRDPSRT